MHTVSCPNCGAPVEFKSFASVMAVCGYCRTTVLKSADAVRDSGRMAAVLEDHSPIQIGTTGVFAARPFTVVGRIQLRYPAGLWNEWYLLFADGETAWLGDFSGQYTLTVEKPAQNALPAFADLRPAQRYSLFGQPFSVAEVRTATCTGGAGELPFVVGQGWQARVADLRAGTGFATLDYSEGRQPTVHVGQSVTLQSLQCQLLRDDDTVRASAGKIRGPVTPLSCPSCGSQTGHVPGLTTEVVCPACRTRLDTSGPVAEVLESAACLERVATTLKLGSKATIKGALHELIGLMRRVDEGGESWTEYLLYSPRHGLLWLTESDEGWQQSRTMDEWPQWKQHEDTAQLGAAEYRLRFQYEARVTFAAGAFNWRVAAGDAVNVSEFKAGRKMLVAELDANELSWSECRPVSADQLKAWFGKELDLPLTRSGREKAYQFRNYVAAVSSFGLLALNGPMLVDAFSRTWYFFVLGVVAIIVPALIMNRQDGRLESDEE